jgi:hypothetical protein
VIMFVRMVVRAVIVGTGHCCFLHPRNRRNLAKMPQQHHTGSAEPFCEARVDWPA